MGAPTLPETGFSSFSTGEKHFAVQLPVGRCNSTIEFNSPIYLVEMALHL